jgi:putative flippase GtrA
LGRFNVTLRKIAPSLARDPSRIVDRGRIYIVIALVCAIANYAIMVAIERSGGHYLLGTIVAFSIVTPLSYFLHSRFTFAERLSWQKFCRFVIAVAATYPAALGLLAIFCSGLGMSVVFAIPIATAILFIWNFIAAHWAILPPLVREPDLGRSLATRNGDSR